MADSAQWTKANMDAWNKTDSGKAISSYTRTDGVDGKMSVRVENCTGLRTNLLYDCRIVEEK
jgi:hypothetical protein